VKLARFQLLAAALLFSTGGVAVKLAALSAWQLAGFRSGVAALVLWLVAPTWRARPRPLELAVAAAYAATLILFITANTLTTAANSIFLQTTAPLWVLAFAPWLLGEANRRRDFVVAAILAAGLVLFFVSSEAPQVTAPAPARGNLVALAAGVTWALTLIGLRRLAREPEPGRESAGVAVTWGNALAFVVCLPFAVPVAAARPLDWALVVYLGAIQIALAYLWMVRGLRSLRVVEASLLLVLEPVTSAALAWFALGEAPGLLPGIGCAVIAIGLVVQAAGVGRPD